MVLSVHFSCCQHTCHPLVQLYSRTSAYYARYCIHCAATGIHTDQPEVTLLRMKPAAAVRYSSSSYSKARSSSCRDVAMAHRDQRYRLQSSQSVAVRHDGRALGLSSAQTMAPSIAQRYSSALIAPDDGDRAYDSQSNVIRPKSVKTT